MKPSRMILVGHEARMENERMGEKCEQDICGTARMKETTKT
jgi:hypothetical protein